VVEIKKEIFLEFLEEGLFNPPGKTMREIIEKLDKRGFTVSGRKIGRISQTMTVLCQDKNSKLERDLIPESEWEKEQGKYRYKKVK